MLLMLNGKSNSAIVAEGDIRRNEQPRDCVCFFCSSRNKPNNWDKKCFLTVLQRRKDKVTITNSLN